MTKNKKIKQSWPTKDAMVQIYENNLWGGDKSGYYSGLGSHHPGLLDPYVETVSAFLQAFGIHPSNYI